MQIPAASEQNTMDPLDETIIPHAGCLHTKVVYLILSINYLYISCVCLYFIVCLHLTYVAAFSSRIQTYGTTAKHWLSISQILSQL
jgi:hypothetical protein